MKIGYASYAKHGVCRSHGASTLRGVKELGCYQVRSVSSAEQPENQQLKLALGFGVEPMERDEPSLAFVMPLRSFTT